MVPVDIAQTALELPTEDRLELARRLVESVVTPAELSAAVAEGIRRIEDVAAGRTPGLTEEQFRAALGGRSKSMPIPELDETWFFSTWRTECVRAMTLVDTLPEGLLYYYEGFSLGVWVCVCPDSLMVAYPAGESRQLIAQKMGHWHAGLRDPAIVEGRTPEYGAYLDRSTNKPVVVWRRRGDWMALPNHVPMESHDHRHELLPPQWPESHRQRISELLSTRTDLDTRGA